VVYGPNAPVEADFGVDDTRVTVRITNTGTLPFGGLDALEPFEHRSSGGLGAALFAARNIAAAAGATLALVQHDTRVEATLVLPRSR
jgi:hypothetical protein